MVVFTCNHCGDTLQKPRVFKHYQFQCRRPKFLTCVDCHKDFRDEEYTAHTKCITEAERYGGKDYVPKAGANKGERKQQAWINVVHNLLNSDIVLSQAERSFLNTISKHENIPRKKAKFFNFTRSAFGPRLNLSVAESVFTKMETAHQQSMGKSDAQDNKSVENNKQSQESPNSDHQANNVAENENNENICKENGDHQNGTDQTGNSINGDGVEESGKKKKKSKKRQLSEPQGQEVQEDTTPKKRKTKSLECNGTENDKEQEQQESVSESTAFNWRNTILEIVQAKGEISVKKLQKKVVSQYLALCTDFTQEKAISKFNKKLKKVSELVVSDEKVKLA